MKKKEISDIIYRLNDNFNVDFQDSLDYTEEGHVEYRGVIQINDNEDMQMIISFDEHFPLSLPDFIVDNKDKFRVHVGSDGKICLFDKSSILIDQDMPEQIVFDCYMQAIKILKIMPGTKEYNEEMVREFESYWRSIATEENYSSIDIENISYKEYPMVCMKSMSMISETSDDAKAMLINTFGHKEDEENFEQKCIFIRIRDNSPMIPLTKTFKWSTIRKYILDHTSTSVKRKFRRFLDLKVKSDVPCILLIYPAPQGKILLGFRLQLRRERYSKIEKLYGCKVESIFIRRIDYQYLLIRGGASNNLKEKNILLLGAGSLGGYMASNLCQSGITNLDILDDDIFMPDNIHRHFLGIDSLSSSNSHYKSDLIKDLLEGQYPYADIDSLGFHDRSAESFIRNYERLKKYDIIISALGEPTINLEINRLLIEKKIQIPLVCCFNEPFGIGGHVIVTNLEGTSCLRCLYTDIISNDLVTFRGSFVMPEQNFKKNVSGCSSSFVPYSCLDSQQTAILATRKIIEILERKLSKNSVYSWLGNSNNLEAQGFKLSEYYIMNRGYAHMKQEDFANKYCQICKKGLI